MSNYLIFLKYFSAILVLTLVFLFVFGLVPEQLRFFSLIREHDDSDEVLNTNSLIEEVYPVRITIPKIGVDSIINSPESRDVAVLDEFLKKGVVHYPGSGTLSGGNMFLFGHSTGFAVVQNQAYKALNDLRKLELGDEIFVNSASDKYVYKVISVVLVDDSEALVTFNGGDHMLTISTCNTFGEKQERYEVEAEFSRVESID